MDTTSATTLFAWLDREVWLVTACDGTAPDRQRGGLIATNVNQATIVPDLPRVLVGLNPKHHTWGLVEASGAFVLHLLSEANIELVWRFGLRSVRDGDKFEGLAVTPVQGIPALNETIGWLHCVVEARLDTGDRTVYLADVRRGEVTHFAPPLTVRRLTELAPPHLLAEMKRQRYLDGHRDQEAIRLWRERKLGPGPEGPKAEGE